MIPLVGLHVVEVKADLDGTITSPPEDECDNHSVGNPAGQESAGRNLVVVPLAK